MDADHLSAEEIERYRKQEMPAREYALADAHVAACSSCQGRIASSGYLEAAFDAVQAELELARSEAPSHLSAEQLAGYADDALDEFDREIVESHMECCFSCVESLSTIRALRPRLEASPPHGTPPAVPISQRGPFLRFWQRRSVRALVQGATATAAAALLVWIVVTPLQVRIADQTAQVARLRETNAVLAREEASMETLRTQMTGLRQQNEELRRRLQASRMTAEKLQTRIAHLQPPQVPDARPPTPVSHPSSPVLILADGQGAVTLDRQGNLHGVPSLSPDLTQCIRTALTAQRAPVPTTVKALLGSQSGLLGSAEEGSALVLLGPIGTVVRSDRPLFRWRPVAGATHYSVTVADARGRIVAESEPLSMVEWRPPQALPRGRTYRWQVAAVIGHEEVIAPVPPAPEARFTILEQAQLDQLLRAERELAGSHLTLGVLYARAGVLEAAAQEFEALALRNPRSPVARRLLDSVRSLQHHPGQRPSPNNAKPAQ